MVRSAVVAGQFYPRQKKNLYETIRSLIPPVSEEIESIAVMSPHAGYIYSGKVAATTFSKTKIPEEVIILGPNHQGYGHPAAVYARGAWETPLGKTDIAEPLAQSILRDCPGSSEDFVAHKFEHSLEVQLPFLQFFQPDVKVVPICIGQMSLDRLLDFGIGLSRVITSLSRKPLIVASTDMTHYEQGLQAKKKDFMALDHVLAIDPEGLYKTVYENKISMCGVLPTVIMLQVAKLLGAQQAELIAYSNSGDVTGDQSEVVGYAGVRII